MFVTISWERKLMNLKDLVDEKADNLSPQLLRAAKFVAANPIEVSFHSMRYIAEQTGLAPPTFSRLARNLGFASYEALREACRISAKDTYSGFHDRAKALSATDNSKQFHVDYGQQSMRNINETMVNIDPTMIDRVAETAKQARKVYINAQMGQQHIGSYAGYVASLAFDNWEILGAEHSGVASQLRGLCSKDVMICLSLMPYATETMRRARLGMAAGAQIIAITDNSTSPIASQAHELILVATANQHFFASQLGVLYVLEAIIGLMVAKSDDTIQSNLQKSELFSRNNGDYHTWN